MSSTRLPSPKALVGPPSQILHIPKQQQTSAQCVSPKGLQGSQQSSGMPPGAKPTIQIKQESGQRSSSGWFGWFE